MYLKSKSGARETSAKDLEVTNGVVAEDQIISHPSEDMYDGMEVNAE